MKKWIIKNTKADLKELSEKLGEKKLICKIISNRGLKNVEEIKKYLNKKPVIGQDFLKIKNGREAASFIKEKINNNLKIRIVGDYDQDGISSTVILMKGLLRLTKNVDYKIPDRVKDGYGISENIINEAVEDNIDTIITCDNGIAAIDIIKLGKEKGLNIIITDHHDIISEKKGGETEYILPPADYIINQKQLECDYPNKNACGAMIAYTFLQNIYNVFEKDINEIEYLIEFVAMATVCDVVDLIGENRDIVKLGLEMINKTENLGLKSLIEVNGIKDRISSYHLGYKIGPCINASGRLDTAKHSVEMFLTEDIEVAKEKAKLLYELNEERKQLTIKGVEKFKEIVEKYYSEDKILVLYDKQVNESIAGIIGGRLKEEYNKPTIIITNSSEEGIVKASCRSVESFNIYERLLAEKDMFLKFGGHPMAAGFSMKKDYIEVLRTNLNSCSTDSDNMNATLKLDDHFNIDNIDRSIINDIGKLEPFGKGNRKPLFGDKNIKIKNLKILGTDYKIIKMILEGRMKKIDAIYFGDYSKFIDEIVKVYGEMELKLANDGKNNAINMDIVYYPTINVYRGNENIQLIIEDFRFRL